MLKIRLGIFLLYKGGTSGFANTGKEPYSEFYAAQVAQAMGIGIKESFDVKEKINMNPIEIRKRPAPNASLVQREVSRPKADSVGLPCIKLLLQLPIYILLAL